MAMLFARLQADVPLKLRRGAWYRVIDLNDLQAVIEVNRRPVGVLRAWLEIRPRPPLRWSVVNGAAPRSRASVASRNSKSIGVSKASDCGHSRNGHIALTSRLEKRTVVLPSGRSESARWCGRVF